jgi:DNA-binding LacI/PurR family transcriptional regulator
MLRFVLVHPEVVLKAQSNTYQWLFFKGIRDAANADGIEVLPTQFDLDADRIESLPADSFSNPNIEGLIFVECGVPDYRRLWRFLEEGRRIVAMDYAAPERGLSSVVFDNVGGLRMATEHLLALGHRTIGYIGPSGDVGQPCEERLAGFRAALETAGLDPASATVLCGNETQLRAASHDVLGRDAASRPTAFVGFSTDYLRYVVEASQSLRLTIPGDLSIVGFGGLIEGQPPMDSVEFDEVAMGRMAFDLWKSKAKGLVKKQPAKLVKRGSSAAV